MASAGGSGPQTDHAGKRTQVYIEDARACVLTGLLVRTAAGKVTVGSIYLQCCRSWHTPSSCSLRKALSTYQQMEHSHCNVPSPKPPSQPV